MTKNFQILTTDTKPQMEEAEKIPIKINTKKSTTKHGIFKLQKIKNKE